MFTVSATYHRVHWKTAKARIWMKRLDHSMIFVLIAGTYTPFALLAMPPDQGTVVLYIVWGGAVAGVLLKMCWPTAPRWVGVPLYLILGWVAAFYIAAILHHAGVAAMVLLAVGGVLYSVGGVLYALAGLTRGRARSATTSFFTRAPRWPRSATTSRSGSRSSAESSRAA